jgi:hypothetical protein
LALRRPIIAAVLAVFAFAGCGGGESADSGDDNSGADAGAGAGAGPAGTLGEDDFIETVSRAEHEAQSVAMDMRIGGPDVEQMHLAGRVHQGSSTSDIAMELTVSGAVFPVPLSVIVVDEVMYLEMGGLTDDKYVRYDLRDATSPMGDLLTGVQLDPTAQLRGFRGAIEDFDVDGTEHLDGVDTAHYRVTVDTDTLLDNLGTPSDELFGAGVEPPDQLTYDFWVGADRLPRRISVTIADVTTRMDMRAWGQPIDIKAPAPRQITKRDPFAGMPLSEVV